MLGKRTVVISVICFAASMVIYLPRIRDFPLLVHYTSIILALAVTLFFLVHFSMVCCGLHVASSVFPAWIYNLRTICLSSRINLNGETRLMRKLRWGPGWQEAFVSDCLGTKQGTPRHRRSSPAANVERRAGSWLIYLLCRAGMACRFKGAGVLEAKGGRCEQLP